MVADCPNVSQFSVDQWTVSHQLIVGNNNWSLRPFLDLAICGSVRLQIFSYYSCYSSNPLDSIVEISKLQWLQSPWKIHNSLPSIHLCFGPKPYHCFPITLETSWRILLDSSPTVGGNCCFVSQWCKNSFRISSFQCLLSSTARSSRSWLSWGRVSQKFIH